MSGVLSNLLLSRYTQMHLLFLRCFYSLPKHLPFPISTLKSSLMLVIEFCCCSWIKLSHVKLSKIKILLSFFIVYQNTYCLCSIIFIVRIMGCVHGFENQTGLADRTGLTGNRSSVGLVLLINPFAL